MGADADVNDTFAFGDTAETPPKPARNGKDKAHGSQSAAIRSKYPLPPEEIVALTWGEARTKFRSDLREHLGRLKWEHLQYLAILLLRAFPESDLNLLERSADRPDVPEEVTEENTWPRVLQRMAAMAQSSDPKAAGIAASFFAKYWGHISASGKSKGGGEKVRETSPQRRIAELTAELDALMDAHAAHEPGEATVVSSGVPKGGQ